MADLYELSSKLKTFKEVHSYWGSMKSAQDEIASGLSGVSKDIESAYNGYTSAASDSQLTELTACVRLAKDATDRIKSHVEGDLGGLFSNGDEVNEYIKEIEQLQADGKGWDTAWYEDVWNYTIGLFVREWRTNDQKKIDNANAQIDHLNKKGEAQLAAMSTAINSVKFGVAGNMVHGGSLGASVTYADNYNFNPEQWSKENPPKKLAWYQELGCLVVGAVEGVFKVVENIFDAAVTIIGNVVSLGGLLKGTAKFFENVVAFDVAGAIFDPIGGWIAGSKEAYNHSLGGKAGYFVGKTAASIVAYAYGGPLLLAAVSMGSTAESTIQNGGGILAAGLKGLGSAAITVITCNAAASLGHWAQTAAKGTGALSYVAKAVNGVNNLIGKIPGVNWLYTKGLQLKESSGIVGKIGQSLWGANTSLVHWVKGVFWRGRTATAGGPNLLNKRVSDTTTTASNGTTTRNVTYKDGTKVSIKTTKAGNVTITTTQADGTIVTEQALASGNVKVTTTPPGGTPTVTYRYGSIYPANSGNTAMNAGNFTEHMNEATVIAGSLQDDN